MQLWKKLCVIAVVITLLGFKLLQNSESRAPIRTGKVNEFWYVACGVDVDGSIGDRGWFCSPEAVRDEWAYYSITGNCGEFYYRVRLSDAAVMLRKAVQIMDEKRQEAALAPIYTTALASWTNRDHSANDVARLVDAILVARLKYVQETAPERVHVYQRAEQDFDACLERSKRYWMTLLFEFIWLSGIVLLMAFPWLWNSGRFLWSICLGIAPLVLFFPVWCGYGDYTFSSCFPDGGVFYPDVVRRFPVLFEQTKIDSRLLAKCPPLFDAFGQHPRGKDMAALAHCPPPGPVGMFLTGLIPAFMLNVVLPVAQVLWRRERS